MMYLLIFWTVALAILSLHVIASMTKNEWLASRVFRFGSLFFIAFGIPLVVIAIITKDPATILGITITPEMQWLSSLLIAGFGAWKFYLDPLKKEMKCLNREMGEVKADLSALKREMVSSEKDLRIIKVVLLKNAKRV